MNYLILIRHSNPEINTNLPAKYWRLSETGRDRANQLADRLAPFKPSIVYSSTEPKAVETGCIAAGRLAIPYKTAEGLEEHARDSVPWLAEQAFQDKVRELFNQPDALILGEETAAEALYRFEQSVDDLARVHPGESIALVSHGTVMTLFVCSRNSIEPFEFWKSLAMPCLAILRIPTMAFERIIDLDSA